MEWRQFFSVLIPLLTTFGGPVIVFYAPKLPPVWKYVLSGTVGVLVGGLGGQFTEFPMHADAGAMMGLTTSQAGQTLLLMAPKADQ